jgi:dTDP-L-rhamnose 4-epimerase
MSLVLITGGAGFIGSHTVDKLIENGFDVRIIDILQKPVHLKGKPSYLNPKAEFIHGDVTNKQTLTDALKDAEYVYHLAAYQDYLPDLSNFFYTNSASTALLYEIIIEKKLRVKKIIVASSQFVQGEGIYKDSQGKINTPFLRTQKQLEEGQWNWLDEEGKEMKWQWTSEAYSNPPNAYALSKFSQEQQAVAFGRRYEIPSVALRYSIVQGPRQSFYNAYSGACRIFSLSYYFGRSPTIYEDGEQRRDFVNIHDVVNANYLVLENNKADFEVFNIGGGTAYSVKEFDRLVAKVFGKEDLEPKIPGEFRFGDTRNACSDISKIKSLGWKPEFTPEDSVIEYKDYLESQTDIEDIMNFAEGKMKQLNVVRKVKG